MARRLGVIVAAALLLAGSASAVAAQALWSNPATWGGAVPAAGDHVVVPQGRRIVLDVDPPPLASLTILGVLEFGPRDLALSVGWVAVHGMLEIGTETAPYPHRATITLTGPLDDNVMGMGARFIGAMSGGRIEVHGSRRSDVDWAVLARHARPGDTSIALDLVEPNKTTLGWRPGDLLAIAPSGRDPLQIDAVTVTAVHGQEVSFTPPLRFHHWGTLQTVAGRVVDERAEVGLLTRNVVIQGAADGWSRNLGGHVMIMAGGIGRIEGAELRHMGQMGRLGRYPIHWHLTGYAPIDYARFNSLWNSFHRGIALHRTDGVEVRGNVAASVWSHTFVVGEDGTETGNVVEDNLAVLTRRLPDAAFVLKGSGDGPEAQDEWRPAAFWVNNPRNTVRGNRAAGGLDAIGFFYDRDHGRAAPADLVAVDFSHNVAHSYLAADASGDASPDTASGIGLFVRLADRSGAAATFDGVTAYQNSVAGAWVENATETLQDAVLADNASGAVLSRGMLQDSLVVGRSANAITEHPADAVRGGVRTVATAGPLAPRLRRVTFADQPIAALDLDGGHVMPGNRVEALAFVNTPVPVFLRDRRPDHGWSGALVDADGSLTGRAGESYVTGLPLSPASAFVAGWGSFDGGGAFVTAADGLTGPRALTAVAAGRTAVLAWTPPAAGGVVRYVVEAGLAAGRTDVVIDSATTSLTIQGAPDGTFFVRVRAVTAAGISAPSNEVRLVVGDATCLVPESPAPLTSHGTGPAVSLAWRAVPGVQRQRLSVGLRAGAADVELDLPAGQQRLVTAAPPGTYFVRIAALNACGASRASNEVTVVVGRD